MESALLSREIVSVHTDKEDWSSCAVGLVDGLSDLHVCLKSISKDGCVGGFEVRRLEDIFKLDCDGSYERKLRNLVDATQISLPASIGESSDLLLDVLERAKEQGLVVTIWGGDLDDSLVGFVRELSDEAVRVSVVDEFGCADGYSWLSLEEIVALDAGTAPELKLARAWTKQASGASS